MCVLWSRSIQPDARERILTGHPSREGEGASPPLHSHCLLWGDRDIGSRPLSSPSLHRLAARSLCACRQRRLAARYLCVCRRCGCVVSFRSRSRAALAAQLPAAPRSLSLPQHRHAAALTAASRPWRRATQLAARTRRRLALAAPLPVEALVAPRQRRRAAAQTVASLSTGAAPRRWLCLDSARRGDNAPHSSAASGCASRSAPAAAAPQRARGRRAGAATGSSNVPAALAAASGGGSGAGDGMQTSTRRPASSVRCVVLSGSRSQRAVVGAVASSRVAVAVARRSRRRCLRRRAGAPGAGFVVPPHSRRCGARPPLFRGGGPLSRRDA